MKSATNTDFLSIGSSSRVRSRLHFRDTNWGFVVETVSNANPTRSYAEVGFKAAGIVILLLGGVVVMPDTGFEVAKPMIRLGLAAGFITTGYSVFSYAGRGFIPELRIDTNKREVAFGTVNSRGLFAPRCIVRDTDVQSFFLMRTKSQGLAILCARSRRNNGLIKIMSGKERDMINVLERITDALRPSGTAGKRVHTKTTGAFITASFR